MSDLVEMNQLDFIPLPTQPLKILVDHYQKVLPANEQQNLIADIKSAYLRVLGILQNCNPGTERARKAQKLIDEQINKSIQMEGHPTCSKGCSACCHMEVEISKDEAQLLAQIVKEGFSIDKERLAIQASRPRKDSEWYIMLQPSNRCVFLGDDGACEIYESRPMVCRKVLVTTDKIECSKKYGKPLPILMPMAEIVLSAALSLSENSFTSLSKALSAALDEK